MPDRRTLIAALATLGALAQEAELIDQYIAAIARLVTILQGVRNAGTARGAMARLDEAITLYLPLRERVKRLAFEQRKERNKAMQEAYVRLSEETKRARETADAARELRVPLSRLD